MNKNILKKLINIFIYLLIIISFNYLLLFKKKKTLKYTP